MPSVFKVYVTVGELSAKIQMAPFSAVLLKALQLNKNILLECFHSLLKVRINFT